MLIEKQDYQNCYVTLVWSKKFVTGRCKLGGEIKKNEDMRLVPVLFLFFKKTLYEVEERGPQAIALSLPYNKNKLYKTFRLLIRDISIHSIQNILNFQKRSWK